jgi:glycosyltransferase involved in cell wall biosynthesis
MPPRYAIVIPAFNEERWLPATLQAAIAARDASGVAGEIIVVDNNSSDDTRRVALSYPGVRPRVSKTPHTGCREPQ